MSKQKKQGFTLIELMVVIVIIGILAAIAIPKLFGMSAKAKASEVGPAAGTWSKLQLAYIVERGDVGTFKQIAYDMPGTEGKTNNFDYTSKKNVAGEWDATIGEEASDLKKACKEDSGTWSAKYEKSDDDGEMAGGPSEVVNGCEPLTPNFCKLASDSEVLKACDGSGT